MEEEKMRAKEAVMKTFQPDEVILKEGETCDAMYKILSGSAIVYVRYGEKDEHVVGIYSKPRCFGEWNLFTGEPSAYTVAAYNQVLPMRVEKDILEDFVKTIRKMPSTSCKICPGRFC